MGPTARFLLRVSIVALLAGLGLMKSYVGDGLSAEEIIDIIGTTLGAGAAYAGIGAAFKPVEPHIGNTGSAPSE